jgi:aryl-alcohol dehydrogenase-like predicted oxidoreductase
MVNGRASCDRAALRATAWRVASLWSASRICANAACGWVIVTKAGARHGANTSWNPYHSRQGLTDAVHDNLRMMGDGDGMSEGSLAEPLTTLTERKAQGLIRHIGLSNVTSTQVAKAPDNHADRLRAEQVQPGAPQR